MKRTTALALRWTPRILALLFAAFISIFALDVFQEGRGFAQTLLALAIHLVPTLLLLAIVAVSWRWPWVGSLAGFALGALYLIAFHGRFPWVTYVLIAGPLFLVGALFATAWRWRRPIDSALGTAGVPTAGRSAGVARAHSGHLRKP